MEIVTLTRSTGDQRVDAAFWLMIHVFQRLRPVHTAIPFPDPDDVFYGYAARHMRLADGSDVATTRNLIRVAGWIATARIAYEAQQYVRRKRDCVPAYDRMRPISAQQRALLPHRRCRGSRNHAATAR